MTETRTATFEALTPAHLDGAVALSRAEGWPHRPEDWALILGLSRGIAASDGDRLVGTAMATPFGPAGTLNMIIVARDWRGRGLARAMLERLMDGDARQWRLIATADGLPLYEKLGFVETHRIVPAAGPGRRRRRAGGSRLGRARRHRGHRRPRPRRHRHGPRGPRRGARRRRPPRGHPRRRAASPGYAALRRFGRGEVAGPVVARDAADARRLLAFLFAGRARRLPPCRHPRGERPRRLARRPGARAGRRRHRHDPRRGVRPHTPDFQTFALAAQALG